MTERFRCDLAWLGGEGPAADVLLEVADDRIVSVEASSPPAADGALRLPGLTLPGLANTHSHAFHRALRGRTHTEGGSFWTWREEMYRVAERLDPDSYHDLARATFGEMVASGYTVVGEFHYLHHGRGGAPYDEPNAMGEALVAAAAETGIRLTLLDALYLYGGIGPEGDRLPPNPAQQRFGDRSVGAWAQRAEATRRFTGPGVRVGAAAHSVRAVDVEALDVVREWCEAHSAPFHIHVSEQPVENQQSLAVYGRTPTQVLADRGLLGERCTAVHATHLLSDDVDVLGESRTTVCLCPTTERDLADGIGPGRLLAAAGARLAIGSDSQAMIDPFEETRAVELNERLATLRRGNHRVADLLTAATANGYRSLDWPEGGRLEAGCLADFVTVGLDSPRLERLDPVHALAGVVFSATAADVTTVVVGGEVVHTREWPG